jgi:hypothetical protein
VTFLPGVDLGATTPGHQPGELAIDAGTYRRWFTLMGQMGIRVVRIYTIHPPAFYRELLTYNRVHPRAPLYLMAGIYLPDESYLDTRNLYAPGPTAAFDAEIADAVAAVHGSLSRPKTRGRASGTWTADVSAWTAGWIAGVEWDPDATAASDRRNAGAPVVRGRYFTSATDATPTERWIAARLERLAGSLAAGKVLAPVAFTNWVTTDPLRHPDEPLRSEDLAQIDANHVRPTHAWRGGYFASYHTYPYYPDFLRHEPDLAAFTVKGKPDAWAGYLRELRDHHAGTPVMITEFGVPSSLGVAHLGTNGRDQGNHSEQSAIAMDAAMLRTIRALDLAGGLLFEWTDEWFKFTWNTRPRQLPAERRALWHDPLTNEQWFGLLAQDPQPTPDAKPTRLAQQGMNLTVRHDPAWVTLRLSLPDRTDGQLTVTFDVVPGGSGALPDGTRDATSDYAVTLDSDARSGQVYVRRPLDPTVLDFRPAELPARDSGKWLPARLTTSRALTIPTSGKHLPAELFDVGKLRAGPTTPYDDHYDSRNMVTFAERTIDLRLPWSLLGIADPSSHQALVPAGPGQGASTTTVDGIDVGVVTSRTKARLGRFTWPAWNTVRATERVKKGVQAWVDAVVAVSGRT